MYEVPAEGGITRYIAFFDAHHPNPIGPVRSTRITFDWIVKGYGVPLAHAGGNVDALNALGPLGIPNLDAIYTAGAAFYRTKSRKIPHNMYTSFDLLYRAAKARHMPLPNLPSLPLGSNGSGPPVQSVTIPFFEDAPIYSYTVRWTWKQGSFYRYINGQPDVATDGTQQHFPNVLIVQAPMVSDQSGSPNTTGATRFILKSGRGYAFMNGQVYLTTWTFNHYTFSYKVNGKPLNYAKGPVFVEVVPDGVPITVK